MGVKRIIACCMAAAMFAGGSAVAAPRAFRVVHYEARIEPDVIAKTLSGTERIDVVADAANVRELEFDAGTLEVLEARIGAVPATIIREGSRLVLRSSDALPTGVTQAVHLRFRGAPKYGLEFHGDPPQVYTVFSTSQWMVCLDDPSVRATLDLSVLLPQRFQALGSGAGAAPEPQADGRVLFRWRQDVAVPSFTYGFAGGMWREAREDVGGVQFRYLAWRRNDAELRKVFADTSDMLRFMAEKAGRPLQWKTYDQALVARTVGQEGAGFALLSEDYGARVLADPTGTGLIAHEAAHQWWGVMVTCADWGHFWLNEGFATYMAAVWQGERYGPEIFSATLTGWKTRVARLWTEGKDHALVYESWNKPTADDRAVVYVRGAYTLHLLREELGDAAFWKAIRFYTDRHWGRSVTTADFQAAVEQATGRDLRPFFDKWVFGKP